MTENEVKKWLRAISATQRESNHTSSLEVRKEALYIAIQALEEIQEYRAIGTIEELQALKENSFFNFESPVARVDEKSYNKAIDDFITTYHNYCEEKYGRFADDEICDMEAVAEQLKGVRNE